MQDLGPTLRNLILEVFPLGKFFSKMTPGMKEPFQSCKLFPGFPGSAWCRPVL